MSSTRLFGFLALATLGGCAQDALTETGISSSKGGFYNCERSGAPDPGRAAKYRVVVLNRDAQNLVLGLGDGQQQVLQSVEGTSGRLFANQLLAWSVSNDGSVLTDVVNIETYACRRITYAEASDLSRQKAGH